MFARLLKKFSIAFGGTLLLCVWIAVVVHTCSGRSASGTITRAGTYASKSNKLQATVRVINGVVKVDLFSANGSLLSTCDLGSDYQRWYLLWDDRDRLWMHSSDIGDFVFESDVHGSYNSIHVTRERFHSGDVPRPFIDQLPSSLKAYLGLQ